MSRYRPCSGQSLSKPFGDERDWTIRRSWSVTDTQGPSHWRPLDAKGRIKLFTMKGAQRYADRLNRENEA